MVTSNFWSCCIQVALLFVLFAGSSHVGTSDVNKINLSLLPAYNSTVQEKNKIPVTNQNDIYINDDENSESFSQSTIAATSPTIQQGLFIIHVTPNPCPQFQRKDRRGMCRKTARIQ